MAVTAEKLKYWGAFGETRFTKSDLWRQFGDNMFPGFPTPEFMARLHLDDLDWIEDAPGPRGGEGWKLVETVVAELKKHEQKKAAQEASANEVMERVVVAFGSMRVQLSYQQNRKDRIVWNYYPTVAIEGRDLDGQVRGPNDCFSVSLPANSKLDRVQREVDAAISYVSELASAQKARLVKQIEVLVELTNLADR